MSWPKAKLGEVAEFIRGITFKPSDVLSEEIPGALGCMRTKNVQEELDQSDVWKLPPFFISNQRQLLQEGDLLVSTANSWNLVGKACWVPKLSYSSTFGGFISALRGDEKIISRRYLYFWFTSNAIQSRLRSFGNKTTNISNLSLKRANDLEIPLPPLAEQKRIAAILDKAAEIKVKREQAIANLDVLEKSQFNCLLNAASPSTYKSIADLVTDVKSISPSQVYGEEQFTYIDIGAVDNKSKMIVGAGLVKGTAAASRARQQCQKGDVLVSTVRPNLNAVTLLGQDFPRPIASTGFCVLRADTKKLLPEVLFGFVKSKLFVAEMERLATGASYPAVTDKIIKAYKVPELSMNDQVRYAAFYQFSQRLRRQFDDHLLSAEQLISCLQQKYFSGELK